MGDMCEKEMGRNEREGKREKGNVAEEGNEGRK